MGITEGGSSGSPLFNTSWQVVGQLFGVCYYLAPDCSNSQFYNNLYGRFAMTFPSIGGILTTVTPDDAYEPNDALGQAPVLTPGIHNLRLVDFDDYFTVNACAPLTITATATFSTGQMDLDLQLLNSSGGVLSTSAGAGPSETVMAAVAAGTYRIRVIKDHGWGGDYTLTITISGFPDCDANGVPDACDPDCNANARPDSCDISGGTSPDCNSNGRPDECDVAGGSSDDCDANGVPDECQFDCNSNGVADLCDISAGTSQDSDANGVPDTCQLIFVNVAQTLNPNTGASWENAFSNLQAGLQRAQIVAAASSTGTVQVWVAAGVYYPDRTTADPDGSCNPPGPCNRNATFELRSRVALYGGFFGDEAELDEREIDLYRTILSGDLLGNDNPDPVGSGFAGYGENSYHVVTGSNTNATAVLDGFTITGGNANQSPGTDHVDSNGGGLFCDGGLPQLRRCRFNANLAGNRGGAAFHMNASHASYFDCEFSGNRATLRGAGGGVFANNSDLTLTTCTFLGNQSVVSATGDLGGGGLFIEAGADLTITGCTFTTNTTNKFGGAVFCRDGASQFVHCAFIGNSAFTGGAVRSSNGAPTFADCTFSGNRASDDGGAVRVQTGTAAFTDCRFYANWAPHASGFDLQAGVIATVINCLFVGNTTGSTGGGAALYCNGATINVLNSSVVSNAAGSQRGGGIHARNNGIANVHNSVFWGNTDTVSTLETQQIHDESGADAIVYYSDVQGGWPWSGSNNIGDNPLFVRLPSNGGDGWGDNPSTPGTDEGANDDFGDLHLREQSPCIDAGSGGVGGVGNALWFDGVDDFVRTTQIGFPTGSAPRTLEAWILRSSPSIQRSILNYGNFGTSQDTQHFSLILRNTAPNKLYFFAQNADAWGTSNIPVAVWTHVAVTYDSGRPQPLRLFVNGVREFSGFPAAITTLNTTLDSNRGFEIGGTSFSQVLGAPGWAGAIDEVRLWNVARSDADIQADMFSALSGNEPGLIGYWPFEEVMGGQIVADLSSSGNAGTLGANGNPGSDDPYLIQGIFDLDGNERFVDVPWINGTTPIVDMGAYEHQPDCNSNGVRDDFDISSNGAPDCNSNGGIDECDIRFTLSTDIDADGTPDDCDDPQFNSYWTGAAGSSVWETVTNWMPNRRPDNLPPNAPPDNYPFALLFHVIIDQRGTPTVSGPVPPATVESLSISRNAGASTLNLATTLTINQTADVDNRGVMNLSAANSTLAGGDPAALLRIAGGSPGGLVRTSGSAGQSKEISLSVENSGTLQKASNQFLTLSGPSFVNAAGGILDLLPGGGMTVESTHLVQRGLFDISSNTTLAVTDALLVNSNGATISIVQSTLFCALGFVNQGTVTGAGGTLDGGAAGVTNSGLIESIGDLTIDGDLTVLPGGLVDVLGDFAVTGSVQDFNFRVNGGTMSLSAGPGDNSRMDGRSLSVTDAGAFNLAGPVDVTLTEDLTVSALGVFAPSGASDSAVTAQDVIIGSGEGIGGQLALRSDMSMNVASVAVVRSACAAADGGLNSRTAPEPLVRESFLVPSEAGIPSGNSQDGNPAEGEAEKGFSAEQTRGCTPPELRVEDNAALIISGAMTLEADSSVLVNSLQPVVLGGPFDVQSVNPTFFDWLAGKLKLSAGATRVFEAAGLDWGPYPIGLTDNFAIGELEVVTGANVTFADARDNFPAASGTCTEAVYVDALTLRAGSTVTLSNVRLYYNTLVNQGGTVNVVGCGAMAQITEIPGDCDGDGDVQLDDWASFTGCMTGPLGSVGPGCECADLNDNGKVDLRDYAAVQAAM